MWKVYLLKGIECVGATDTCTTKKKQNNTRETPEIESVIEFNSQLYEMNQMENNTQCFCQKVWTQNQTKLILIENKYQKGR